VRRFRSLPLGVDLGSTRMRIALCEGNGAEVRLQAVSSREVSSEAYDDASIAAALLEEMLGELRTRERRCVTAVGAPDAVVRAFTFPKMTWGERLRAARFEASRFVPALVPGDGVTVRVHAAQREHQTYFIGAARSDVIARRVALMRNARLRVVGVDYDALALARLIAGVDAIFDIGCDRSTLHVSREPGGSYCVAAGGASVTHGIARDLAIDYATAERRKRILGATGAGANERDELVRVLGDAIVQARTRSAVERIALVGNGAKLPGLAEGIEARTGTSVDIPVAPMLESGEYPHDVLRAAAPDWTLAAALASWSAA
jgi:type IV pilus assembly protein PilM